MYPAKLTDLHPSIRARAAMERRIVRSLVNEFAAQGFTFVVDDGEDLLTCANVKDALGALVNTDDDILGIVQNGQTIGYIRLIYGNDGYDVMADWDTVLESLMPKTLALTDELSRGLDD